jgi:hypothetical protein
LTSSSSEWQMSKIPKIAHCYWGNTKLPFIRYATLLTFSKMNPDWQIKLYTAKDSSEDRMATPVMLDLERLEDYTPMLKEISNITIEVVDLGEFNYLSETHKSDLLRWQLLATCGGLWIDSDIVFFRPMTSLVCNHINNKNICTVFVNYPDISIKPIGFLLSSVNNSFYKKIASYAETVLRTTNFQNPHDNNKMDYQVIGTKIISAFAQPSVYNAQFVEEKAVWIGPECVYLLLWHSVCKIIYEEHFIDFYNEPEAIGCHYYGGSSVVAGYMQQCTIENYKNFKGTLSSMLEYALEGKTDAIA